MSLKYSSAGDYPDTAKAAIKEMHRQVGDLVIENGSKRTSLSGHLVLPDGIAGTEGAVDLLQKKYQKIPT